MDRLAILIMAAGESKRLGRPKQLLAYKNTTLLNHTISTCVDAKIGPVFVLLGANKEAIQASIDYSVCKIITHTGWYEGLSSSIAFGVNQIDHLNLKGLIIVLADQIYLSKQVLQDLAVQALKGAKLINSSYKEGSGPPSYFDRCYFAELKSLEGDQGAKKIVQKYADELKSISFPQGHIDIDTPEDLALLDL